VSPELADPAGISRRSFAAMGTEVLVVTETHEVESALVLTRRLFAEWELVLSRFLPESELSRLNASAGKPFDASRLLFDVVSTALEAARASGGLFDPTLLADLVRIGYDRSFADMPGLLEEASFGPVGGGGWRRVELDRSTRRITLPAGAKLDVGGIAKGMAVDAALEQLDAAGIGSALVSAGGDLAVRGLPPALDSWPIAVGGDRTTSVPLARGALATSGRGRRAWRQGTVERHHLLDPRTGEPARSGLREVTVVAATCAQAEVAAKAAYVLGARLGGEFVRRNGLAARFLADDGSETTVGLWPARAVIAA
jgi:thiamine biosynthesis lipoprotein